MLNFCSLCYKQFCYNPYLVLPIFKTCFSCHCHCRPLLIPVETNVEHGTADSTVWSACSNKFEKCRKEQKAFEAAFPVS